MTTDRQVDDAADGRGLSRRRYLGATAAAATAAVAGCSGILGGGDGGGGDPEAAVQDFYSALNDGDADAANAVIHPEGNASEITAQQAQQLGQAEFSVDSTEVVEEGDGRAVVSMTVTLSMGGEEQSQTSEVEVRTHEGQWKIWAGEAA